MAKILINQTASPVSVSDTGITVPASGQYTIPPTDYPLWAASDDIVTLVGAGTLVVNDGSVDLGISDGIDLIKGIFQKSRIIGNTDDTLIGNHGDKLKIKSDPVDTNEQLDILGDILRQLKIITVHLRNISDLEMLDGDEEEGNI